MKLIPEVFVSVYITNTETAMKVLIYKRTHMGDPDERGVFGIYDCMGRMRNWNFDAVIGIGGKSPWKGHTGIKQKINWIGLGPKKIFPPKRGHRVVFDHFKLYEEAGVNIELNYPNLFDYMYSKNKRFSMSSNLPEKVLEEVKMILNSIKDCPASPAYNIESEDKLEAFRIADPSECRGCSEDEEAETSCNACEKDKSICRRPVCSGQVKIM